LAATTPVFAGFPPKNKKSERIGWNPLVTAAFFRLTECSGIKWAEQGHYRRWYVI